MSNELTLIENNPVKLNQLFGFEGRPKPVIPTLKINGEDEEEGVTAPKGTFVYDDGDRVLYSRAIIIRVFTQAYQYRLWDSTDKSKTDASIIATNFREEFRSTSGRIACGKLSKKEFEQIAATASDQQKYFQEKVKCKLIIFGLISGTFVDLDTKEQVDVENALFVWTTGQSAFMDTINVIKGIEKERRAVPQTPIAVGLKKEKNGAVTYFTPTYEVATTIAPMVAARDMEYLLRIKKFMKDTNDYVNTRYNDVIRSKQNNKDFAEVNKVVQAETDNFINDPLEF